jgi:copper(I)-binding protein
MANTFKVVNFAAEPASAGTAYKMYTVAGSTTTVVLGLILTNIHSSAVTVEVELHSDTANRAVANNTANGISYLVKDVTIPAGSSLELLSGGKVVLEATDELKIDCSVTDKVSGTLSIMEIT